MHPASLLALTLEMQLATANAGLRVPAAKGLAALDARWGPYTSFCRWVNRPAVSRQFSRLGEGCNICASAEEAGSLQSVLHYQ